MTNVDSDNSDLFDGFRNGSHHLWVVCEPNWRPYDGGDARYLELDFHATHWKALFRDLLGCPEYDHNQTEERNRELFRQSIPDFPMLGQVFDSYEDYSYHGYDLERLRNECRLLQSRATDATASKALRKLIYACDEATNAGCALMLVCD
jgi:hypothetical protein